MKTIKHAALATFITLLLGGTALAQRAGQSAPAPRLSPQAQYLARSMENGIRQGSTPHLHLVPRGSVRVLSDNKASYGTHKPSTMAVTGLQNGRLEMTALMPVSGHVGWSQAQSYASTNQYNLTLQDAAGGRQSSPKIQSTGFVTPHDFSFTLKPGTNVLDFWPDGSGGVGGYIEGRRVEINWDGR